MVPPSKGTADKRDVDLARLGKGKRMKLHGLAKRGTIPESERVEILDVMDDSMLRTSPALFGLMHVR